MVPELLEELDDELLELVAMSPELLEEELEETSPELLEVEDDEPELLDEVDVKPELLEVFDTVPLELLLDTAPELLDELEPCVCPITLLLLHKTKRLKPMSTISKKTILTFMFFMIFTSFYSG